MVPRRLGGKIGAIVGLLVWSSVDLGFYAGTTIFGLTVIVLDPLLASVWYGIGGEVIAAVLERRCRRPVLCAQGHAVSVTGRMVGFVVPRYTGIIERRYTQTQE